MIVTGPEDLAAQGTGYTVGLDDPQTFAGVSNFHARRRPCQIAGLLVHERRDYVNRIDAPVAGVTTIRRMSLADRYGDYARPDCRENECWNTNLSGR